MLKLPEPPGLRPIHDVDLIWDQRKHVFVCTIRRYLNRVIDPPIEGRSGQMWNAVLMARCLVDDYFDAREWER